MEVQTAARSPSGTGSSSAAYPRWVILEKYCNSKADGSNCPTAVAKTVAAARTSNGRQIQVSLSLQDPPATSAVRVKLHRLEYSSTLAAHGGSLLIDVMIEPAEYGESRTTDYFVYNVGDAAADPPRPPSLLLLPQYNPSESEDSWSPGEYWGGWGSVPMNRGRGLRTDCTGILCMRRPGGEDDEVVVVELQMVPVSKDDYTTNTAELLVFSSGDWSVKRPRIWYDGDDDELEEELPSRWNTTSVFAVGDTTTLCWADTSNGGGLLFYNVLQESPSPRLHYVPFPKALPSPCLGRTVCAMAGGGGSGMLIRLVNIFPRCCCGGAGASYCQQSHHAYTITTWTLRMDDDGTAMEEWVMDGMADATELWSLDAYKGLPRIPLVCPVVSMYEPHVICFSLCERYHVKRGICDETLWLVIVDMRSKTIRSVSCHPDTYFGRYRITSNVSNCLNPYQTCSSGDNGTLTTGQSHTGQLNNEKMKIEDNNVTNLMLQSLCKSNVEPADAPAQASSDEILAAIREIPSYGLGNGDMLKAYQILSGDNGSRVRSLLRLPKNLRKDWLLIEIKVDDAY